ncbi:cytidylyltransferase domain-containing protein [Ornithinibacillus scapharcae]|uniref:cytidylyltransferase domain-containing protein n=1 Tax=Ornithinibacillus scapharcae TaxID=1147159 RepID=UPI000225AB2F|nr:glycosyltransferase family protein [Ornithinibacillus scapharcae]
MRIVTIIQARMGSSRLPGKVLKPILEKPILAYQVERVKQANLIDEIVIATSTKTQDDPIITWCNTNNILFYRGEEEDVLGRYYEAAKKFSADAIVRLTGDCPIIDPKVIELVISSFLAGSVTYASNTIHRTYPRGMDTEIFTMESLEEAHLNARLSFEREHVTPYIRNHYPTLSIKNNIDHSNHRWTIDTLEDFNLIQQIIKKLYPIKPAFSMEDVIKLLEENPSWMLLNHHIKQKDVY